MRLVDDRTGLEALDPTVCLDLLRAQAVGRVAVVLGNRPFIFPVNYVVDGDTIVFRTSDGTKLEGLRSGFHAAFEIDGVDPLYHGGWSVLVSGRGREVVDGHELEALRKLELLTWAPGDKGHWIRIRPDTITGRRIATARS
jgi:nitroimidazol reductase NimA-like FMN-containing flavoprotein (pyridoxamine 5'-phosphate oxidase superfamily)